MAFLRGRIGEGRGYLPQSAFDSVFCFQYVLSFGEVRSDFCLNALIICV